VTARTEAAARVGVRHLSGRLSGALAELREKLVAVKARAELLIDFPEEEAEQAPQELVALLGEIAARTDALLGSFRFGRLVREGLHVAIVGRPNVGKSSLLNALLGAERAIVTEVPGTTRDVIEESVDMDGIPVVLADTAGVGNEADMIERLGIERALEKARSADGTIVVLDRSEPMSAEDERVLQATAARPRVIAVNKCDLPARWLRRALAPAQKQSAIEVSAKTGAGIPELRQHLARVFEVEAVHTDEPVLTLVRHRDALAKALEAVGMARRGLASGDTIDVVAVDIQEALEQIGEITGAVTSEDVLDRIFREFCIGK